MDHLGIIIGIAAIPLVAISSPGPTLFVVAGHAASDDWRASLFVVLGVAAATVVWSSFAAAGLGAALVGSGITMIAVR